MSQVTEDNSDNLTLGRTRTEIEVSRDFERSMKGCRGFEDMVKSDGLPQVKVNYLKEIEDTTKGLSKIDSRFRSPSNIKYTDHPRVLITGLKNSGKSSFINLLLGKKKDGKMVQFCPVEDGQMTSVIWVVKKGNHNAYQLEEKETGSKVDNVLEGDDRKIEYELSVLCEQFREKESDFFLKYRRRVVVKLVGVPFLEKFTVVDSPGFGEPSLRALLVEEVERADLVYYLLSATNNRRSFDDTDKWHLKNMKKLLIKNNILLENKLKILINKADIIPSSLCRYTQEARFNEETRRNDVQKNFNMVVAALRDSVLFGPNFSGMVVRHLCCKDRILKDKREGAKFYQEMIDVVLDDINAMYSEMSFQIPAEGEINFLLEKIGQFYDILYRVVSCKRKVKDDEKLSGLFDGMLEESKDKLENDLKKLFDDEMVLKEECCRGGKLNELTVGDTFLYKDRDVIRENLDDILKRKMQSIVRDVYMEATKKAVSEIGRVYGNEFAFRIMNDINFSCKKPCYDISLLSGMEIGISEIFLLGKHLCTSLISKEGFGNFGKKTIESYCKLYFNSKYDMIKKNEENIITRILESVEQQIRGSILTTILKIEGDVKYAIEKYESVKEETMKEIMNNLLEAETRLLSIRFRYFMPKVKKIAHSLIGEILETNQNEEEEEEDGVERMYVREIHLCIVMENTFESLMNGINRVWKDANVDTIYCRRFIEVEVVEEEEGEDNDDEGSEEGDSDVDSPLGKKEEEKPKEYEEDLKEIKSDEDMKYVEENSELFVMFFVENNNNNNNNNNTDDEEEEEVEEVEEEDDEGSSIRSEGSSDNSLKAVRNKNNLRLNTKKGKTPKKEPLTEFKSRKKRKKRSINFLGASLGSSLSSDLRKNLKSSI